MVNFGGKAKIKKAGNLNSCRSYVITTVRTLRNFKCIWSLFWSLTGTKDQRQKDQTLEIPERTTHL